MVEYSRLGVALASYLVDAKVENTDHQSRVIFVDITEN